MANVKISQAEQTLRRIGNFDTDAERNRVLAQVEGNVATAQRALQQGKTDTFQATPVQKKNGIAKFGDIWVYDPRPGTLDTIQLPRCSLADAGKWIILKNKSSSVAAVVVRPAPGQLIDGLSTVTANQSYGRTWLFCDGQGWLVLQ